MRRRIPATRMATRAIHEPAAYSGPTLPVRSVKGMRTSAVGRASTRMVTKTRRETSMKRMSGCAGKVSHSTRQRCKCAVLVTCSALRSLLRSETIGSDDYEGNSVCALGRLASGPALRARRHLLAALLHMESCDGPSDQPHLVSADLRMVCRERLRTRNLDC